MEEKKKKEKYRFTIVLILEEVNCTEYNYLRSSTRSASNSSDIFRSNFVIHVSNEIRVTFAPIHRVLSICSSNVNTLLRNLVIRYGKTCLKIE